LIDVVAGRLPLSSGTLWVGPGVVVGELTQQRDELARGELASSFTRASGLTEEDARTLLAKFGVGADHVRRDAGSLSPGERTRALLALLVAQGVNCLILDEPTNHLDVPAIEELERAVEAFDGTVILVTHDRRFLHAFRATKSLDLGRNQSRASHVFPADTRSSPPLV
jgi:ATPase subunit of ABC transporter with duplicated ATPase domains